MGKRGEVLVAIANNLADWEIIRRDRWYRIPVQQVKKRLKDCFSPEWLAFYQTKIFDEEAYAINYYSKVQKIEKAFRWELFPDLPADDKKRKKQYFKLEISELEKLDRPILSRRLRRLVFIPTTWEKFVSAVEINDLWDESPLEDRVWAELKRLKISAERQEHVTVQRKSYFLDFAIYCECGKIDIETDGDTWHANKEQAVVDNERDNNLKTVEWHVLRFNTHHLREKMADYCVPTIVKTVNRLGGVKDRKDAIPRKIQTGDYEQLSLFD